MTAAIFDFITYFRLNRPITPAVYSSVKMSAVTDLAASLALVPLIMGIMKLSILGDEDVQRHFGIAEVASLPSRPM
ncbi:MAG TPA: hypothetical protein VGQ36_24790 [Thermoanaerobaculia bacterium]|nr:hypothetical protein [Thermoanaerobaculia bacterium]